MKENAKKAFGIGIRVAFVIAVTVTVILKYRELVSLDVRGLVAHADNVYIA